jgi:1-acyl-sn-glycerol-3-phosphate acyltransferase
VRATGAGFRRMNPSYLVTYWTTRAVLATYFGWRVYHPERVPATGPVILAANHASFMDPHLIGASVRRDLHYLARASLFRNPLVAAVLRSWNVVPVDRDGGSGAGLKAILDRLNAGAGIILFPEGTRTMDGQLQPARAGIGLTVIKSSAPVVPLRIFGTFAAFGRHRRFPAPRPVAVKFAPPMDFAALRAEAKTCSRTRLKALYQQVADDLMAVIARLQPATEVTEFPSR